MEHLCGMIARRIMKKDLTRGWTTWLAMWEDLVRRKRMLQHAASSLKNPELSAAYRDWKNLWIEIKEAKSRRQKARRKLELAQKAREGDLSRHHRGSREAEMALEDQKEHRTRGATLSARIMKPVAETDKKEKLLRKLSALDGSLWLAMAEAEMALEEQRRKEQEDKDPRSASSIYVAR